MVRALAATAGWLIFFSLVGPANSDEIPNLKDPQTILAGRKLFAEKQCAHCHGADGNGGIKLARRDDLQPIYVFQAIADGRVRGSLRMPSWAGVLTVEEIWQATAYVLSLSAPTK
jgi:mono/diheme cytochrome c family protein